MLKWIAIRIICGILIPVVTVISNWEEASASQGDFYVVSTDPVDGGTQFNPNSILSITFSKTLNDDVIFDYPESSFLNMVLEPDSLTSEPDSIWLSEDRKTVFVENFHLKNNQAYVFIIGNAVSIDGDSLSTPYVTSFTTGDNLPTATISGVIQHAHGGDPIGTLVLLMNAPIFSEEKVSSAGLVSASNGEYEVSYIPSGVYWPVALQGISINNIGDIILYEGSFKGIYDIDGDLIQDSIIIGQGSSLKNINFLLSKTFNSTARQSFDIVQPLVQQIASDAALVTASAFDLTKDGESLIWAYEFYSETKNT